MDKHENSKDDNIMIMMMTMIMLFSFFFFFFVADVYPELTPDLCEYQDLSPNLR